MTPQVIGHISGGSGSPESDIQVMDFGGGLKTRFRADRITPGAREVVAITVGICDGGTLSSTSANILVPVAGAPPTIAGGLGAIPCITSAGTDGLATGVNGGVIAFRGTAARHMGTVRVYADADLDGILFEPGELVTQGVPIFNEGTGEAILSIGRQGQMLIVGGGPLAALDPTTGPPTAPPFGPLLLVFTVDVDTNAPSGQVNVELGLSIGDDTAQGAAGICAAAFGTAPTPAPTVGTQNCGSNLSRAGPARDSFSIELAGGRGGGGGPAPSPPSGGGSTLKSFDTNGNNILDDNEFFNLIDAWIQQRVDDQTFFRGVDAWVAQTQIQSLGRSPVLLEKLQLSRQQGRVTFRAQGQGISSTTVEIYSLDGRRVFSRESPGATLAWNLSSSQGQRVSNGVYLYRVTVEDTAGRTTSTRVRKLLILR